MAEGIRIGGSGKNYGAYVWHRFNVVKGNYPFTLTQTTAYPDTNIVTLKIEGKGIDCNKLSANDLVGISGFYSDGYPFSIISSTEFKIGSRTYPYTYNPENGEIKINHSDGMYTTTWTTDATLPGEIYTSKDFVVNDDSSAYPNGAVHTDGYWYEKAGELPLFGASKVVIDTFTFSSDTAAQSFSVTHSLGEQPKACLIIGELSIDYGSGYIIHYASGKLYGNSTRILMSCLYDADMNDLRSGSFSIEPTETQIKGVSGNSIYNFRAGIEYTLITMA